MTALQKRPKPLSWGQVRVERSFSPLVVVVFAAVIAVVLLALAVLVTAIFVAAVLRFLVVLIFHNFTFSLF